MQWANEDIWATELHSRRFWPELQYERRRQESRRRRGSWAVPVEVQYARPRRPIWREANAYRRRCKRRLFESRVAWRSAWSCRLFRLCSLSESSLSSAARRPRILLLLLAGNGRLCWRASGGWRWRTTASFWSELCECEAVETVYRFRVFVVLRTYV